HYYATIMKLSINELNPITFSAAMESPQQSTVFTKNNELILSGKAGDHEGIPGKVRFQSITDVEADGGTVSATDSTVEVSNANEVTIRISIASNFKKYDDISANEIKRARNYLDQAEKKSYSEILEAHKTDYKTYFNRVNQIGRA